MAASYPTTDSFPPTRSVKDLSTLEMDMVERLNADQSVLQDQDRISIPPLCGNAFSASSCGFNTESFHIGGYENAADTPRSYHSHTHVPSFEKNSPGILNEMFYHGNGVPSDFQRSSNSIRNQSPLQHYGDLYADDSRHFVPFDSSNQQYPVPEHIRVSPEFHMFQANSIHFDRHANERNSSETDYRMCSGGLRNNMFVEPMGLNFNPFSGEQMFLPMTSTRTCMTHLGSPELSANDFDMGPRHGVLHDAFESAASLSYREQAYNQCKRGPFTASSSSPTWDIDHNLRPHDEARSGSYSDFCHFPAMHDMLTERNRGPRASRLNGKNGQVDRFCQQDLLSQFRDAKFFVIKSYSEDNVHKSIKYCVWASTKNGNKKLDAAYREAKKKEVPCPVFLLFSVNASAQFCGVAEMVGPVDFNTSVEYWQQDRWTGHFPVKWLIVKDVPNSLFRHIIIENNDNKPVTNSRDTQEVGLEQGIEMLKIFKNIEMRSSILDDFSFYEERQRAIQDRKARQRAVLETLTLSATSVPTHRTSSLHDNFVREMSKSFAEALALQYTPN
ncbi:YTH domain-containing protein ECT3 [Cardamine amara subsp. amara]|uniref:YTH domain-containing family protein n=1 Tax=Cardamine amara subsp. amara TaxID=228776 RepID=A0ABD1BJB1_CARAN